MMLLLKFIFSLYFAYITLAIRQGYTASPGEVPYHVSIEYRGHHICNGVLTLSGAGEQVVLTTASCVMYPQPSTTTYPAVSLQVLGGRVRLDRPYGAEQRVDVRRVRYHRALWRPSEENNLAVLFLAETFNYTRLVRPVRLPGPRDELPSNFIVSGWGHEHSSQTKLTQSLKVTTVLNIDHTECYNRYYHYYWQWGVFPSNLCAGGYIGNYYGACEGDEGGPAVALHNDEAYLAGIYIWRHGECDGDMPGIFANMFKFARWLDDVSFEPNSTVDGYGR